MNNKKITLFYANWCPYSQEFLPIWQKLIEILDDLQIKYETIDCTNRNSRDDIKIEGHIVFGYPTMYITNNGKTIEYKGKRTVKCILEKCKVEIFEYNNK